MDKKAQAHLREIVSGAVAIVFMIYFVNVITTELDFTPFVNPNIFYGLLVALVIIFFIDVWRKLFR